MTLTSADRIYMRMKEILGISCVIIIGFILLITLIIGISGFTKSNPANILTIIIPSLLSVMLLVCLVWQVKSKEWPGVICMGYGIILILFIIGILFKNEFWGLNLADFGIGLIFLIFSFFIFKLIGKVGSFNKIINFPFERVQKAVIKGLNKLELPICGGLPQFFIQKDNLGGTVVIIAEDPKVYESADESGHTLLRIEIGIRQLAEFSTEIRIRVGVLGNMKRSRQILAAIESFL